MNEKGLPPALNGDASLEEVFAGLKPSLPPTCGFSSRCSYVTRGISLILKKNKAFISSRNLEKQFSEDQEGVINKAYCCDVTMARHIGQPRSRVYDSLLQKTIWMNSQEAAGWYTERDWRSVYPGCSQDSPLVKEKWRDLVLLEDVRERCDRDNLKVFDR